MSPPRTIVEEAAANAVRSSLSYPLDLIANGRNYYVEFDFYEYTGIPGFTATNLLRAATDFATSSLTNLALDPRNFASTIGNNLGALLQPPGENNQAPRGNLRLPMPRKINDNLSLTWGEISGTQTLLGIGANLVSGNRPSVARNTLGLALQSSALLGVASGYSINPLLFMQFQRPNFRQFRFDWLLAPKNERESRIIKNIVSFFKNAASPTDLGPVFGYPQVALIKFYPDNGESSIGKHMVLKPCVIRGISVDYSPQGTPSFFKNTNAPTLVAVSLDLIEIQLWFRGNKGL
jgi:hypothetical protein